jgi:hypothetical protein
MKVNTISLSKSQFYILHFTFYIIFTPIFLTILSCSSPTSNPKGSLSGYINLENQFDHSEITAALYDLAELDPDIVYANVTWPHIGVKINQHTEFDHRFQSPIADTQTEADGSFFIPEIPVGKYNLVAKKDGWGFKYLFEVEILEGENLLADKCKIENVKCKIDDSADLGLNEIEKIQTTQKSNRHSEELSQSYMTKNLLADKFKIENVKCKIDDSAALGLNEIGRMQTTINNSQQPHNQRSFHSPQSFDPSSLVFDLKNRTSDLTLYPETTLSGFFPEQSNFFLPDHHYIIEDDTVLLPDQYLEIQSGAVIRINPGIDLTIHGSLKAQGEENNMFWVTSNDCFTDNFQFSILNFTLQSGDSPALYNSMEMSDLANVVDDLISWGKWSWGNNSFNSRISDCRYLNSIFRNSVSGIYVSSAENIDIENVLSVQCNGVDYGGVVAFHIENLYISKSILQNNHNGIYSKFSPTSLIKNNFISQNHRGIWGLTLKGNVEHNELSENSECDIKLAGNTIEGVINIMRNNLRSGTGIWQYTQGSFLNFYIIIANYNNFYSENLYIKYYSRGHNHQIDIDATLNYYNNSSSAEEIALKIFDYYTGPDITIGVIFQPFLTEENPLAGIQDE